MKAFHKRHPTTTPKPVAKFRADPRTGTIPFTVRFTDVSTGFPSSWAWNFGDGNTSTARNPTHIYTVAGTYTVTLMVTNSAGQSTKVKPAFITATAVSPPPPPPPLPPEADFVGAPTSGNIPLAVQFTDQSINGPTAWAWTFGDTGISSERNPAHTYGVAGTYNVALTATNAGGSDTITKPGYIVASTPAPPPPTIGYLKGVWSSIGPGITVPQAIVNNLGVVGLGFSVDWSDVETAEGVYNWTLVDTTLNNIVAAGFNKVVLAITNAQFKTPDFILDVCEAAGETFVIPDVGEDHSTFCDPFRIPLWWSSYYRSRRLALVAAMGARYANNPNVHAVFMSFMNVHSMDWDNPDAIGFLCNQNVNMVQQWIDHGWTRGKVLDVGKEMADAVAAAFPNQVLKLPVGGMDATLAALGPPDPDTGGNGVNSTLAREMDDYIFDPARSYSNRVYISRNVFAVPSPTAQQLIDNPPSFQSQRYPFEMVRLRAPHSYLQTVAAASQCVAGQVCRQNGSQPCVSPLQVMTDTLTRMLTYGTDILEIFTQDAQNPAFYNVIADATLALGGTLRT